MASDIIKADLNAGKDPAFRKIQEYWLSGGKVELSKKHLEINDRYRVGFTLMRNEGYIDRDIVNALHEVFGSSLMQSYRDLANIKLLFGDVVEINSKLERYFALQEAKEFLRDAKAKGDLKARGVALRRIIEIGGFNNDSFDAEIYAKLEKHEVVISLPPDQMKIFEAILKSGTIDFSNLIENTEIPEFEVLEAKPANEQ